ncbi:MAG: hypothetical protein WCR02_11170 [Sphaerochaetaceae bacterium]
MKDLVFSAVAFGFENFIPPTRLKERSSWVFLENKMQAVYQKIKKQPSDRQGLVVFD